MDRLLSPAEVADLLGVAVRTVYAWSEAGVLPHRKLGRLLRFAEEDLEGFIRASLQEAREGGG